MVSLAGKNPTSDPPSAVPELDTRAQPQVCGERREKALAKRKKCKKKRRSIPRRVSAARGRNTCGSGHRRGGWPRASSGPSTKRYKSRVLCLCGREPGRASPFSRRDLIYASDGAR